MMKKYSFAKLSENRYVKILAAMAKAVAASFLPYLFIAYTIAAGTDELYSQPVTDFLASLLTAFLFSFFFHTFYTQKKNKDYALNYNPNEAFQAKREFFLFLKEDGIPFLKVYAALSLFQWLHAVLFYLWHFRSYLSVFLWFLFPLQPSDLVTLPQLFLKLAAPLSSILFIFPMICLLAVLSRKKLRKSFR